MEASMTTEEAASVFLGDVDSIKGLIAAVEIFKSIGLLFNNAARTRPAMVVKGTGDFDIASGSGPTRELPPTARAAPGRRSARYRIGPVRPSTSTYGTMRYL
jgi:hypothetical protein